MKKSKLEQRVKELEAELSRIKSGTSWSNPISTQITNGISSNLSLIIDNFPAFISYVNVKTLQYEYVNAYYEKTLSIPRNDIIGSNIEDVVGNDIFQNSLYLIEQVRKTKRTISFEEEFVTKKGKIWYHGDYFPVFENGEVAGTAILCYEISELKQIEQAKEESDERFLQLFQQAPLGYQSLDVNGNFIDVNHRWSELLGYSKEEVIGKWFGDFLSAEYKKAFKERFPVFLREGKIHSEFEMVHKNGSKLFISFEGKIGSDENHNFKQTHCILQDITQQRLFDEMLRKSEAKLKFYMDNSPMGIIECDSDFVIIRWTGESENIFGWKAEEVIGKSILNGEFIIRPDGAGLKELKEKIEKEKLTQIYFCSHNCRKDGKIIVCEWYNIVLRDETGNLKTILSKIFDITERKGLEEKITESEKRYRTIFENAGDGILILDSDKRIISVNESFARMHGYTVAELLTMQLKDLDTKESYERSDELLSKASDGSHFTFEISHYSKKGEVITLEVNSKPLVIKNKHCFVAFHRDITERKQLLGELKGSEEYFRSLFEKNPTASCIIEPDARISKVNSRFCELTGYTRKEVIGKSWIRLIHDDDKERLIAYRQNRFSGKKDVPDGYEFKYCRKDGVVKIGLISIVLLTDNNILASFIDITNLKQLEKELKLNEEYFRTIFENNSVAIAIIEPDSTISMVNNKFSEILDYTKDEICGTIWTKYVFRDDLGYLEQFPQSNDPDMAAQPYSFEFRFVRKHGEIRQALINAVVLSNMKTIASVLDITERKEMELELVYAKEKAQESDRLKSAFLSNMSHEIRTPMNGILGFSELLKEPNLSHEEQQNFINTIVNSGERLLNTINAIIDISKIESGMTGVDLRETNINDKLDFTYTFFRRETDEKGLVLYLNKRLPAEESFVSTDNEKVYSILANLVKNAIKFTKEGSVEFGCERIDNYLRFFVKDTGPGIPENHKEFIFERFRQGSESHDRGYEGSGLGLSISKNYVEMLGGQIWFESEVNKGTTFYFTVPSKSVSETKMGTKDISKIGENNVQEGKLKILITEDDEVSYSLLIRMLQGISLKIFHAVNGAEAIQHCHENPDLDLILMDIRMPEMNGLEATKQIRQFNQNIIIIAQTAFGFSSDCEKAMEAGCNDYISKPINKKVLIELIHKYC